MPRRKPSPADRMQRIREGRCPVHGTGMCLLRVPVESVHDTRLDCPGRPIPMFVIGCVRRDCKFWSLAYTLCGPWELPAEFSHLIAPDFAQPDVPIYVEQSAGWKQAAEHHRRRLVKRKLESYLRALGVADPDFHGTPLWIQMPSQE